MTATGADNQDTWPNNVDQTDDWHSQAHYGSNWYHQDQTKMQQLALPQPDSSAVPISGLQEVAIAMIGAAQQFAEDNKWVSLVIDSGAATPVCPPWFATQFPLQCLEHGTPFYVCEVKQPILSVARLVEQGFQLTLDDNPRLQRTKGLNSTFGEQRCLFFLQADITTLPRGTKLQTHRTQQGQIGMIAPTATLTPQGPADTGYAGGYWQLNTQGEPVRVHRQYRKTLFTPSTIQPQQNNLKTTEESDPRTAQRTRLTSAKYEMLKTKHNSKCGKEKQHSGLRKAQQHQRHCSNSLQQRHSKSAPQKVTPQVLQYNPRTRLREKQQRRTQQHHTPPKVQLDKDYRTLQKYIMVESTGTEKAHTGREHTSSHTHSILRTRADT